MNCFCAARSLPPPPQLQTWEPTRPLLSVRFRPERPRQPQLLRQLGERPRQPSSQEMDIFEEQEMSKSRSQVNNKLNELYN